MLVEFVDVSSIPPEIGNFLWRCRERGDLQSSLRSTRPCLSKGIDTRLIFFGTTLTPGLASGASVL
jgi:hypothetical protein